MNAHYKLYFCHTENTGYSIQMQKGCLRMPDENNICAQYKGAFFVFLCWRKDSRGVSRGIFSIRCNHDITDRVKHSKHTQQCQLQSCPHDHRRKYLRFCSRVQLTELEEGELCYIYRENENGIWLMSPPGEQELNEPSHFFLVIQRDHQMMLTKFL